MQACTIFLGIVRVALAFIIPLLIFNEGHGLLVLKVEAAAGANVWLIRAMMIIWVVNALIPVTPRSRRVANLLPKDIAGNGRVYRARMVWATGSNYVAQFHEVSKSEPPFLVQCASITDVGEAEQIVCVDKEGKIILVKL